MYHFFVVVKQRLTWRTSWQFKHNTLKITNFASTHLHVNSKKRKQKFRMRDMGKERWKWVECWSKVIELQSKRINTVKIITSLSMYWFGKKMRSEQMLNTHSYFHFKRRIQMSRIAQSTVSCMPLNFWKHFTQWQLVAT